MLHNDRSKSMINNHQGHADHKPHAHPIDRLLIGYQKNRLSSTSFYRAETNHLIQRQRVIRSFLHKSDENEPSIRKPMILSATPKSLSISSTPINNNRQQFIAHISPVLTRRLKIEHVPPSHSISSANDLPSTRDIPSNFTFRPPVTQRSSSLKLDSRMKTITEYSHKPPLIPSISIPRLSEQDFIHTRTLTSTLYAKSRLLKQWRKHRHSSSFNRLNNFDQTNDIEQLFIKARMMNNFQPEDSIKHSKRQMKVLTDDGKDSDLLSGENSSTSTCRSQLTPPNSSETDLLPSSSSSKSTPKKPVYSRRRIYNHALPPVTEDFNDEETESLNDMKKKLVENNSIRPQKKEKRIHHLIDEDETSLTFDILNQEETKFEKQLFKSRRFH